MANNRYPVLEERPLDRAKRRLLVGGRREPADLPPQLPGTVLVFEVGGRFEVLHDRRHLSGREEAVVDAVAVSVVDMRARAVTVDLAVASVSAADDFTVRARFDCKVTQPDLVAAAGLTDLTTALRGHLGNDRELVRRCGGWQVEDINSVREWVTARVAAYCKIQPLRVGGMTITLAEVEVLTPTELRTHATGLRDEGWRQLLDELRTSYESREIDRTEAILHRGPEATSALAIVRGQEDAGQASERAHQIEAERRRDLLEMVKIMAEGHHLDTAPVDAMRFVDAFADQTIRAGNRRSAIDARAARPRLTSEAGGPRLVEEDDLLG